MSTFTQWIFLFYVFLICSVNQAPVLGAEMPDRTWGGPALSELRVQQAWANVPPVGPP